MPWCPKCEVEYREGFTECSDCKSELIDELETKIQLIPFIQTEKETLARRLVKYFNYSKLDASYSLDESTGNYIVLIPEDQQKSALKHYKAFLIVEESMAEQSLQAGTANAETEDVSEEDQDLEQEDHLDEDQEETEDTDDEDIPLNNSKPYVMKADRYKDDRSTGLMFLLFGIGGIIFVVLNYLEIFTVVNNLFQYIIFTGLFVGFIIVSIGSYRSAKKLKPEIEVENQLTQQINAWLSSHITKEYYDSIYQEEVSAEVNYIAIFDHIKVLILKEFGQQDISYIDRLIDEYYDRTF